MKKLMSFFLVATAFVAFAYMSPIASAERMNTSDRDSAKMDTAAKDADTSHWIGKDVKNTNGEELGKVKDFVRDADGKISLAVISHGGLMGVGGKRVAVPFSALSFDQNKDHFVMNATKDQIAGAPEVQKDQNLADRSFEEQVYRYFGVRPYWTEKGASEKAGAADMKTDTMKSDTMKSDKSGADMKSNTYGTGKNPGY